MSGITKLGSMRQGPPKIGSSARQVPWMLGAVGCGPPATQLRSDSQPATISALVKPQWLGTASATIATDSTSSHLAAVYTHTVRDPDVRGKGR